MKATFETQKLPFSQKQNSLFFENSGLHFIGIVLVDIELKIGYFLNKDYFLTIVNFSKMPF